MKFVAFIQHGEEDKVSNMKIIDASDCLAALELAKTLLGVPEAPNSLGVVPHKAKDVAKLYGAQRARFYSEKIEQLKLTAQKGGKAGAKAKQERLRQRANRYLNGLGLN